MVQNRTFGGVLHQCAAAVFQATLQRIHRLKSPLANRRE